MTDTPPSTKVFEVEVKTLIEGGTDQVMHLQQQLEREFSDMSQVEDSKQLNHYFQGQALPELVGVLKDHVSAKQHEELTELAHQTTDYSVRTRELSEVGSSPKVLLVVKASIDDTTSQNGIARREFEAELDLSIDQLDQLILEAGFEYQAKWSRQRQAYEVPSHKLTVSIDKNAGYGFLAEFEKVVSSESEADQAVAEIRSLLEKLELIELAQDRLERMFAHYNQNWPEYYGTDKTFRVA